MVLANILPAVFLDCVPSACSLGLGQVIVACWEEKDTGTSLTAALLVMGELVYSPYQQVHWEIGDQANE